MDEVKSCADNGRHSAQLEGCAGIRVDVTGNCNIRCPYCINDFSLIRGNLLMDRCTFEKVIGLLPLLRPDGHLLFSCYFEPTLHPQFLEFLSAVPSDHLPRGGFTTNLSRRLPDSFFDQLAQLRLGYINVSIDSLDPSVFEQMRQGARFDVFSENLDRLVRVCSEKQGPALHFITMISKLNLDSVGELINECSARYRPKRHEIRASGSLRNSSDVAGSRAMRSSRRSCCGCADNCQISLLM
jgi:MoaA/NifB/PqqE/SkfB family radical SAM enzyme